MHLSLSVSPFPASRLPSIRLCATVNNCGLPGFFGTLSSVFHSPLPDVSSCQQRVHVNGIVCSLGLVVHAPFWQWHWANGTFLIRQLNSIISFLTVRFSVPLFLNDYIQGVQVQTVNFYNFYDVWILDNVNPCIPSDAVVFIFDIESNIGRDTIY
jgi:hypothetical protein